MKNTILNLGILLAFFANIQFSDAQNNDHHKTSQDHVSADKRIKKYNADIENAGEGMAYNNGYYRWLKSKKNYKVNKGEWDQLQDGYKWDKKTWENPKHAWRYSNSRFFNRKNRKFKTVLKKGASVGKDDLIDQKK